MGGIYFADPRGFHEHLLKFTGLSTETVTYNGNEYRIEHTQYASYPVQQVFEALMEQTGFYPGKTKTRNHRTKIENAIKSTDAYVPKNLHREFSSTEYLRPRYFTGAVTDYGLMTTDNLEPHETPVISCDIADSRGAAMAQTLSVLHAKRATQDGLLSFMVPDDDDHDVINEGVNPRRVHYMLRDTAYSLHGPGVFTQPDPSFHLAHALFDICDAVGFNIKVRKAYGWIVDPSLPRQYAPDDASQSETGFTIHNAVNQMADDGYGERVEKWLNPKEPPLDSLYENEEGEA